MLTDIFLIRHGQPMNKVPGLYNVLPGPDLSEPGRSESLQAAAFLTDKTIEHLFASPFARTTQTAEAMVEILCTQITFTKLIQEQGPAETQQHVRDRVREFLACVEDSPLRRIAMVSHGSPIRQLLLELTNDKIDLNGHAYPGGNPAPTAGIWHARREGDVWRVELVFKPT